MDWYLILIITISSVLVYFGLMFFGWILLKNSSIISRKEEELMYKIKKEKEN